MDLLVKTNFLFDILKDLVNVSLVGIFVLFVIFEGVLEHLLPRLLIVLSQLFELKATNRLNEVINSEKVFLI